MKTIEKDKVKTILENESNRRFFKAKDFHGDIGYGIAQKDGKNIFVVKTKHGNVYYELDGSRIGDFTSII